MTPSIRAELYYRETMPAAARVAQSGVLDRLHGLYSNGAVSTLDVRTWPHRVTVGEDAGRRDLAVYREFDAWARDHDVSLAPAFDVHDCHSFYTGEDYTTTVLPVMCLAIYEDGDLASVYPHRCTGGVRTVLDGVAMLESTGERPSPNAHDREVEP